MESNKTKPKPSTHQLHVHHSANQNWSLHVLSTFDFLYVFIERKMLGNSA